MTGPVFVVQMHLQVLSLHILPAEHNWVIRLDQESNPDFVMTGCSALSIEILKPTGEQAIVSSFKIDLMVEMTWKIELCETNSLWLVLHLAWLAQYSVDTVEHCVPSL